MISDTYSETIEPLFADLLDGDTRAALFVDAEPNFATCSPTTRQYCFGFDESGCGCIARHERWSLFDLRSKSFLEQVCLSHGTVVSCWRRVAMAAVME